MDELARKLLIEQTRKETLDKFREYHVGWQYKDNKMVGYIFEIPVEKYKELFGGD